MVYPVPTSLSPSRVEAFTSCPLAFRFASIDKLPEPPSIHAARGTLVHRALELLFVLPSGQRTPEAGLDVLDQAVTELQRDAEYQMLALEPAAEAVFVDEAEALVRRYFTMENPNAVREIGIELRLEVAVGGLSLRGIIDRLELDDDGGLVVTDYKTGRPPRQEREQTRLGGVHFYSFLCEELFGRRPSKVQLLYLSTGEIIETRPTERSVAFLPKRTIAVYRAVTRACETGDFRPRPSALCGSCAFQRWCPSFGGDPSLAATEAPALFASPPAASAANARDTQAALPALA